MQNPAELRGTGGLIGAYSLLRIDDGRFRFSPFEPIQSLAQPPLTNVPSPNGDYAAYEQFRRHGLFWTGINVLPDFPSVGQAILASYEASTDTRLDGVVIADPFALAALLEATGPVEVPGYGIRIDADTVVPFTTNEAYSVFKDPNTRKRILGDVARAAFGRFVVNRRRTPSTSARWSMPRPTATSWCTCPTTPCRRVLPRHRSAERSDCRRRTTTFFPSW